MIYRSGDGASKVVQWAGGREDSARLFHLQSDSRRGRAGERNVWVMGTAPSPEARKPEDPAQEPGEGRRLVALNGICFVLWRC